MEEEVIVLSSDDDDVAPTTKKNVAPPPNPICVISQVKRVPVAPVTPVPLKTQSTRVVQRDKDVKRLKPVSVNNNKVHSLLKVVSPIKKIAHNSKCVSVAESTDIVARKIEDHGQELMQSFLETVRVLVNNSEEVEKITQKMWKHLGKAQPTYVSSSEFSVFIEKNRKTMSENPELVYIHIKNVLDNLKSWRLVPCATAVAKGSPPENEGIKVSSPIPSTSAEVEEKEVPDEQNVKKKASDKHIRKLEKLLVNIERKINKLEEREVDMEDEDNSIYIIEDRLKKRAVKVWEKLCELTNRPSDAGRVLKKKFKYEGSRFPEINHCIERFINHKQIVPDFRDVCKLVELVNSEKRLRLAPDVVSSIAEEIFKDVGERLQERRIQDHLDTFGCALTDGVDWDSTDPAKTDFELQEKLENNKKLFGERESTIFENFSKKQEDAKLVPQVVEDDDTANHSAPEEGETDEDEDENSKDRESSMDGADSIEAEKISSGRSSSPDGELHEEVDLSDTEIQQNEMEVDREDSNLEAPQSREDSDSEDEESQSLLVPHEPGLEDHEFFKLDRYINEVNKTLELTESEQTKSYQKLKRNSASPPILENGSVKRVRCFPSSESARANVSPTVISID